MSDIHSLIENAVNEIWGEYDADGSGQLDKSECKRFIASTLSSAGQNIEISDHDFEQCFTEYDADSSGQISKAEMSNFILKAAGLA